MNKPTRYQELKLIKQGYKYIAGVDEAGRGSWAGPLVAAAVIFPVKIKLPGINDSKKLTASRREALYTKIIKQAVAYSTYTVSSKWIDKHGVGQANKRAIIKVLKKLKVKPKYVLIDSFRVGWTETPSMSITKGDAKIITIAAASIIAKVTRDRIMSRMDNIFPSYGFLRHKGYGTTIHLKNIKKFGMCPQHRRSFRPMSGMREKV